MMHIKIYGDHSPLKKDGHTDKDKKEHKKKDPIELLRNALTNKLRSKHWRFAHGAKTKWMEAAKENAEVIGTPASAPCTVVVFHAIPGRCDIDAPIKVLLDAFQDVMFENGDDNSIESLIIRRHHPERGGSMPQIHIFCFSTETELGEAAQFACNAVEGVDLWRRTGEPA